MDNLNGSFHRYFEVIPADTDELIKEAYRIRYRVYCLQNAFEDPKNFPDQMEFDEFDGRAVHSFVRHRESGHFAGVVRLVLPDWNDPDKAFPIEKFCKQSLGNANADIINLPRNSTAEISRFAVCEEYKRRIAEYGTLSGVSSVVDYGDGIKHHAYDRRLFPHITLGLFTGIVRMSAEHNITHWLAVMEPTLLRLLTRFGIYFKAVGPQVDYHGIRQPTVAVANDVMTSIYHHRKSVWDVITDHGEIWPISLSNTNSLGT